MVTHAQPEDYERVTNIINTNHVHPVIEHEDGTQEVGTAEVTPTNISHTHADPYHCEMTAGLDDAFVQQSAEDTIADKMQEQLEERPTADLIEVTVKDSDRLFFSIQKRGTNELNSNLTELNAAHAVEKGFVTHNDWIAHTLRYAYAGKFIMKNKIQTVLDVGCGNLQLPYFAWRNRIPALKQYVGLDLRGNEKWLDEVGWATPLALVRADVVLDVEQIDEVSQSVLYGDPTDNINVQGFDGYDLVVNFENFEHVPNESKAQLMANLFHWTKPGGYCLFSTPNAGVSDSTAHNHTDPVTGESREFPYETKLEMAKAAGFVVKETYGTFCGITRIPSHKELLASSPVLRAAKEFLPHAWYTCVVAAAYPEFSNNALFVLRRPN